MKRMTGAHSARLRTRRAQAERLTCSNCFGIFILYQAYIWSRPTFWCATAPLQMVLGLGPVTALAVRCVWAVVRCGGAGRGEHRRSVHAAGTAHCEALTHHMPAQALSAAR